MVKYSLITNAHIKKFHRANSWIERSFPWATRNESAASLSLKLKFLSATYVLRLSSNFLLLLTVFLSCSVTVVREYVWWRALDSFPYTWLFRLSNWSRRVCFKFLANNCAIKTGFDCFSTASRRNVNREWCKKLRRIVKDGKVKGNHFYDKYHCETRWKQIVAIALRNENCVWSCVGWTFVY